MAFIEIQKAGKILNVTKSMFENFYKNAGWEEAGKKPASSLNQKLQEAQEDTSKVEDDKNIIEDENVIPESSDEDWDEALEEVEDDEDVEKPISEMTRSELIKFANDHGVSLAGLTKNDQFRNAIKEALNKEN